MLTKFTFLVVVCVAMAMAQLPKLQDLNYEEGQALAFPCVQLEQLNPEYLPHILSHLKPSDIVIFDHPINDHRCWIIVWKYTERKMDDAMDG